MFAYNKHAAGNGWPIDRRHGTCNCVACTHTTISGEWKNGKKHGHGLWSYENGYYLGGFKADEKHGSGEETFSQHNPPYKYVGEYKRDAFHGTGVRTSKSYAHCPTRPGSMLVCRACVCDPRLADSTNEGFYCSECLHTHVSPCYLFLSLVCVCVSVCVRVSSLCIASASCKQYKKDFHRSECLHTHESPRVSLCVHAYALITHASQT